MQARQKGFTLIEIIVVLIILGVLAAIALPNIFSHIQRSQAFPALSEMKRIKDTLVPCLRGHVNDEGHCFPSIENSSFCACMTPPNLGCACTATTDANFTYFYQNFVPNTVTGSSSIFDQQSWLVSALRASDSSRLFLWGESNENTHCSGTLSLKGAC